MAFVLDSQTPTIPLYLTHEVPPALLSSLERDFSLAAHSSTQATLLLSFPPSPRPDDHLDLSPEQALEKLGEEAAPFLLATKDTVEIGGGVWYVQGWLDEEDLGEMSSELLSKGHPKGGGGERTRWAARLWIEIVYAPMLYVNLSISNTFLFEHDQFPSSLLSLPDSPDDGGCDWRLQPPVTAYVAASRGAYEISTEEGDEETILGGGEEGGDARYRLKEEWATKLGLVSRWTQPVVGVSLETAWGKKTLRKLKELGMGEGTEEEESVVSFPQDWVWSAPEL